MDIRDYERIKFGLAEILRSLPWEASQYERRRALFARLAEDRFNLVVVGRFNRGKSSLMNAILGMDRLPTGVVPLTSVITTITYGSQERVTLHYRDSMLLDDITLADLPKYITERGNPGNRRRIETAEVQLPAAILRRGFHFIDTPGLGSAIAENTRTTEVFMPEADALVVVTSFDSPLSAEELAVLHSARLRNRRVFLAINKLDTVTPAEREQVEAHIAMQMVGVYGDDAPAAFPVSARNALTAKCSGDSGALAKSGVGALEQALIDFLVSGKRQEFLVSMGARLRDMLAESGHTMSLAHLDRLLSSIVTPGHIHAPRSDAAAELAADIPPCEICARIDQAVFDFIASYQGRLSRDPAARAELAHRHGLCGPHSWQFERVAAPREICMAFAEILEAQAASLRMVAHRKPGAALACEAVQQRPPNALHCPVCDIALASQSASVAALAAHLDASPVIPPRFPAICLPHLGPLLAALNGPAMRNALRQREADLLDRFADDMRRFALKQDAARRWALNQEELTATQRGSRMLVGAQGAFIPALPGKT